MRTNSNPQGRNGSLSGLLVLMLLCISALLFASSFKAALARNPSSSPLALGNYPNTSIPLSTNTTASPDAPPTDTTSINVSTSTDFKGTFAASPTTGLVTVTDAHPAGTYTVTVTAFGPGGTTTKNFALTVTSTPCGAGFTDGFTDAADVNTGVSPQSVAIGDFNGDGKQDLAVANYSSNTVSIRLGDGLGGFSGSTEVSVGSGPYSVAIGDFNGDGQQDLAVANYTSNTASIRLGDGLGGFSGSTELSTGLHPASVAIGDFNGDGQQDLVIVNGSCCSPGTALIRLGDGLGGFSGSTEISVGSGPLSVAIGDFNGDGKQDLAVATANSGISIRLGDGLGGFNGSTNVPDAAYPVSVAIGDFNGDGMQDFAAGNVIPDPRMPSYSIGLGNGSGGFSVAFYLTVGAGLHSVAIGDFNRDGHQDLAVTFYDSNSVLIRLGDGLGGFTGFGGSSVGSGPRSVAIGDFNGDGKQDFAVANYNSNTVAIRLGQCIPVPTPTPTATATATATATISPTATATATATATSTPPPATPTPTISEIAISGTISDCSGPIPGGPPVSNVTMTLTGVPSGSTTTDGSGNYSFSGLIPGNSYTVTPSKAGLVPGGPGSSAINTLDVIAIQKTYLNIMILTGCRALAADCAPPTGVGTVDVLAAQKFFLQLAGSSNVGKYKFNPLNLTYSPLVSSQTGQDYVTVVLGDVVAPFVP